MRIHFSDFVIHTQTTINQAERWEVKIQKWGADIPKNNFEVNKEAYHKNEYGVPNSSLNIYAMKHPAVALLSSVHDLLMVIFKNETRIKSYTDKHSTRR